jgi:hypothetical protein
MKVKCLVTEKDVKAGEIYEVHRQALHPTSIYVTDDKGEEWYLISSEYEVVDEPV